MNYYPHHIGDYLRDTSHLSLVEHGAYRRMLDLYYASEKPLPLNIDGLCRLVQAKSKAEREAVDTILEEFFDRTALGWINKRADEEIAAALEEGAENKAKRENEVERQRRHRERRKKLFEELRAFGEIPKWDTTTDSLEALLATVQSRTGNAPVTRDSPSPETDLQRLTKNQEPRTNSQKPVAKSQEKNPSPGVEKPTPRRVNGNGVEHLTPTTETWNAYAAAYQARYGVAPTRNKTVNGQLAQFVTRVPVAEAPEIAAFYVGSARGLYVSAKHPINLLLRDAESLRTEWLTGKQGTDTEARQADRAQATGNAFAPLIAEAEARERIPDASK